MRKGILRNFAKFTGKHLYQSLFQEGCGPEACNFIKKRVWHRSFPVNCAKFLRTPFLQNNSGRLLQLLQQSWRSEFSVLVSERILKKKVSGEIAFDLISLFHVQIQDPTRSWTTMRAFVFPSKLKFDTRSRWWPKHLCGWT